MVVILPDGGRSYLSKIYNDAWMRQYGFLERKSMRCVRDVLRAQARRGRDPVDLGVETRQRSSTRSRSCTSTGVSQLPVVSSQDPTPWSARSSERGLLKRALEDPALLGAEIVDVMEPPFPAVSTTDTAREAVDAVSAENRQALTVIEDGARSGS